jgi:hypothetical protein
MVLTTCETVDVRCSSVTTVSTDFCCMIPRCALNDFDLRINNRECLVRSEYLANGVKEVGPRILFLGKSYRSH